LRTLASVPSSESPNQRQSGQRHAGGAERGQVVGVHPARHALGHPDEQALFGCGGEASMHAGGGTKREIGFLAVGPGIVFGNFGKIEIGNRLCGHSCSPWRAARAVFSTLAKGTQRDNAARLKVISKSSHRVSH